MARSYQDVSHFCSCHAMPIPKLGDWRLVEQEVGQINGLPQSRGTVIVTDGIMCMIERLDGSLYVGHYTAWVADPKESATGGSRVRTSKSPACFADFNI